MVGKLSDLVTGESVAVWLLIAFLVGYFIYKEWPEFKKRVSKGAVREQHEEETDRTVADRLDVIEKDVKEINGKLDRDYQRINRLEVQIEKTKNVQANTSEELVIIMEALLGALGGLQELGANGPTKEAKDKIHAYLNKKAHKEWEECG